MLSSQLLHSSARSKAEGTSAFDYLRVQGWHSDFISVQKLLDHLGRKTKSEASRRNYCWHLARFSKSTEIQPNLLRTLRKDKASRLVQSYADKLNKKSAGYANSGLNCLKTFFETNGYKNAKSLDLESYHVIQRFRVTSEYIPTKPEIYVMADCASSLRDRAIILTLFSSGFRNATLRALRMRDIESELERGFTNLKLPVYIAMKEVIPNACKGGIEYYGFSFEEATEAIRLYVKERATRYGKIESHQPLFAAEYNQIERQNRMEKFMSARELQYIVKSCAERAGLPQWQDIHPHSIRKSCDSVLHTTNIEGENLDPKYQEFLMGHILPGSQDRYFDRDKIDEMRDLFARLKWGRVAVENRFSVLRGAVARAFQGTGLDPDKLIEDYVEARKRKQLR